MSNCQSFRQDFDACRDGTLAPERQGEVFDHLAACEPCRRAFQHGSDIEFAIREEARSWQASTDLWQRIEASVEAKAPPRKSSRSPFGWMAAALVLLAVSVTSISLVDIANDDASETIAAALVNEFHTFVVSHRPLDLAETHPAEVRKWFGDKVEFRVPLPVQNSDMKLAGGRLCNMFDQRIASFMYQVDDAWVSLYIMHHPRDRKETDAELDLTLNGYGFIDWEHQGLYYSLVGDLPVEQLRHIAEQLRAIHSLTRAKGLQTV